MKKVISIALALCLCLICFVGCGNKYKGWEDQTLEDISFKVPPTWTEDENGDDYLNYYITRHGHEELSILEDVILKIHVYDQTLDKLMEQSRNNKYYTNVVEKETKIAGQEAYHVIAETTGSQYYNSEVNDFYFKISENKACRISISKLLSTDIEFDKKEIYLFLDSIKINK